MTQFFIYALLFTDSPFGKKHITREFEIKRYEQISTSALNRSKSSRNGLSQANFIG